MTRCSLAIARAPVAAGRTWMPIIRGDTFGWWLNENATPFSASFPEAVARLAASNVNHFW